MVTPLARMVVVGVDMLDSLYHDSESSDKAQLNILLLTSLMMYHNRITQYGW